MTRIYYSAKRPLLVRFDFGRRVVRLVVASALLVVFASCAGLQADLYAARCGGPGGQQPVDCDQQRDAKRPPNGSQTDDKQHRGAELSPAPHPALGDATRFGPQPE